MLYFNFCNHYYINVIYSLMHVCGEVRPCERSLPTPQRDRFKTSNNALYTFIIIYLRNQTLRSYHEQPILFIRDWFNVYSNKRYEV